MTENKTQTVHAGWEPLAPEALPRSTWFPAAMALGTTLAFWSLVTSWMVLIVGAIVFTFALAGWIREIRHERSAH